MSDNLESKSLGLNDLLGLFEDDITVADITAENLLGKISASIVKKRIDLDMTQKQFASYINVSQGMVSKWEGGDYNFSIKSLADIAEKLDMDLVVSLNSRRCGVQLKHVRQDNILYVISESKEFTGKNFKAINYKSATPKKEKINDCKVYSFRERLEM